MATVTGLGSVWNNSAYLIVGYNGVGALTIADGGVVNVAGGTGPVEVGLESSSSGTINIGAAAGDTAAAAGTLNAGTLSFGLGTGKLVFNHTGMAGGSALDFNPQIAGVGTIDHLAGTTILTGDSSGFGGTTTVSGGTLLLGSGAALGGTVNVGNGGALGGTGTLGTTTIAAGGGHTPGYSIGTQTINGDYTNHGTLVIEANPSGAAVGDMAAHLAIEPPSSTSSEVSLRPARPWPIGYHCSLVGQRSYLANLATVAFPALPPRTDSLKSTPKMPVGHRPHRGPWHRGHSTLIAAVCRAPRNWCRPKPYLALPGVATTVTSAEAS